MVQVQLGLMKSCFIQKHTHTKHNIISWYKPDGQVHQVIQVELQPNIGLALVFQAWGVQNLYIHTEICCKSPSKVNFSGHREQKEIIHFPSFTSSWALSLGKMCITQPLAVMAVEESLGKGLFWRLPSASSQHPDTGMKYRFFFPFNILKNK